MSKLTQAEFLARVIQLHGEGRYDYTQTIYRGYKEKLEITCPVHGSFWQLGGVHLEGRGCPSCAKVKKLNREEFVARAKDLHGERYDYSASIYKNNRTEVIILCREHGPFLQAPNHHLLGGKCPSCRQEENLSKRLEKGDAFIEKARALHGDRYDYSLVKYVGSNAKVKIICPTHGVFEQRAERHVKGNGCNYCKREVVKKQAQARREVRLAYLAISTPKPIKLKKQESPPAPPKKELVIKPKKELVIKRLERAPAETLLEKIGAFIEKARVKHGERYDYSNSTYKNSKTEIIIICREHGPFLQEPNHHLQGGKCPSCRRRAAPAATLLEKGDAFIEKARALHGDRYDYSLVEYKKAIDKVKIICPTHGVFEQSIRHHAKGSGCAKCSGTIPLDTLEFIEKARALHGDRYDYSLVEYRNHYSKVKIICSTHGMFEQGAGHHASGQGCRKCGREAVKKQARLTWIERAKDRGCILYFLRVFDENEEFYKVGVTFHSVKHRYGRHFASSRYKYEVLASHKSTNAAAVYDWEQSILHTFSHLSYKPSRSFGGDGECFSSANEILSIFPL